MPKTYVKAPRRLHQRASLSNRWHGRLCRDTYWTERSFIGRVQENCKARIHNEECKLNVDPHMVPYSPMVKRWHRSQNSSRTMGS